MSHFSKHAMGGVIASKVDQQDAVAIYCALKLIADHNLFGMQFSSNALVELEQQEDVHLKDEKTTVLISVKSSEMAKGAFENEVERLAQLVISSSVSMAVFTSIDAKGATFRKMREELDRLDRLLENKSSSERAKILAEFQDVYGPFPVKEVKLASVADLDSTQFSAEMASLLRRCLPIADYTDERVVSAIDILRLKFAEARRVRGSVQVSEVRDAIFAAFANPMEVVAFEGMPYVLHADGYHIDREQMEAISKIQTSVHSARSEVLNRFRKSHAWTAFKWFAYSAAPPCRECSHPMMANIFGLGARGIACPQCGFTPFVSLFYACSCGAGTLLLEQPLLSDFHAFNAERLARLSNFSCSKCGAGAVLEEASIRLFQLNIPASDWSKIDNLLASNTGSIIA